jgi:hypothetical protein
VGNLYAWALTVFINGGDGGRSQDMSKNGETIKVAHRFASEGSCDKEGQRISEEKKAHGDEACWMCVNMEEAELRAENQRLREENARLRAKAAEVVNETLGYMGAFSPDRNACPHGLDKKDKCAQCAED